MARKAPTANRGGPSANEKKREKYTALSLTIHEALMELPERERWMKTRRVFTAACSIIPRTIWSDNGPETSESKGWRQLLIPLGAELRVVGARAGTTGVILRMRILDPLTIQGHAVEFVELMITKAEQMFDAQFTDMFHRAMNMTLEEALGIAAGQEVKIAAPPESLRIASAFEKLDDFGTW